MNPHEDLTPGVMAGLAWYYMIAAVLNAGAAAYIAYGTMVSEGASRVGLAPEDPADAGLAEQPLPRTLWPGVRRDRAAGLPARAPWAPPTASVPWRMPLLAIMAGADAAHFAEAHEHGHGEGDPSQPPSLDEHHPAVGIGGPINRTLWTLIWGFAAMIFQMIGVTYVLGHEVYMPQFMRDGIDWSPGRPPSSSAPRSPSSPRSASADSSPTGWSPGRSSTCSCSSSA